jgi:hypothetical protein
MTSEFPSTGMNKGDISTYPVIISTNTTNNVNYGFYFSSDVIASFSFISFYIPSSSYTSRWLFGCFY